MASPSAQAFVAALRRVEDDGDVEPMAALFADDAVLTTPTEHGPHVGPDGARRFWTAYRHSFQTVRSRFHSVLESDRRIMLEWTSQCRTAGGVDATYAGVSTVDTREGRIVRFAAYFDPARLHAHPSVAPSAPVGARAPLGDRPDARA